MKIITASKDNIGGILEINKIIDYSNPEIFMMESIEKGRVLVALDETNRVVGYLLFQTIWGNTPFISLIKILPNFQKKGLGSELLILCEEKLRELGFKYYYSSTGNDNPGAQVFHNKMGFSKIGNLKMNFGDEIFYRKNL